MTRITYNDLEPCDNTNCGSINIPSYLKVNRPGPHFTWLLLLSILRLFYILVTGTFFAENTKTFFASKTTIYDLLMFLPFLFILVYNESRFIFVPYFLRVFLMIPHFQELIVFRKRRAPMAITELTEKGVMLVVYVFTLIYFGVCSFNYFETRFQNNSSGITAVSLVDSFYFIVITFSTVGYGDITPKTVAGRIVIILLIFAGVTILPGLVGSLVDTFKYRSAGLGIYSPKKRHGFVVCCGIFSNIPRTLDLIEQILFDDPTNTREIVLLSREPVPDSLRKQLKQFRLRRRVTVLVGNGIEPSDLVRISLRKAAGVFIFADTTASDYGLEDQQNAVRALSFDRYAPNTAIYVETLLPIDKALQFEISNDCFCIQEFKQMLMGYSTIVNGCTTFILNLIRSSMVYGRYDRPWHIPYLDGVNNWIKCVPTNPVFIGHSFTEISLYIFRQFQAVLFALKVSKKGGVHIVLNPGPSYVIKNTDYLILLGPRSRLEERLRTLVSKFYIGER